MKIKEILSKTFEYFISTIMIGILLIILFMCLSNVFYTVKNWSNLKKGVVSNISTGSFNEGNYLYQVLEIKIDSLAYRSGDSFETKYVIGDSVLVQPKGNKTVRVLYVNNKKVGSRINKIEYLMMFFSVLLILILIIIIKNKIRKK
ncbi:hypothetical protein [uncultured Polaribacter sp.]|uniref:hypothetical protein n=1 Tax=uncultured Polaribacter sp. TaxID=174711 RepID=UPI00261C7AED|nr:hypothetical protein [uncultured Polaribacter sp.]